MTPERRNAIDDDTLDAAIRTTLAVEPSPAFQARVRERIAQEPVRASWSWTWSLAGLVAAVALAGVIVAVSLSAPNPASTQVVATPPTAAVPDTLPPVASPVVEPPAPGVVSTAGVNAAPRIVQRRVRREVRPQIVPAASLEPEILLDQRELVAFRQLIRALDPDRVDLRTVQRRMPSAEKPLPALATLAVQPVVVTPLPSLND